MPEIKLTGPSMEERIAARLRNSGDPNADIIAKHGDGPTRCYTNITNSPNYCFTRGDESPEQEKDTGRAYNSPERGE